MTIPEQSLLLLQLLNLLVVGRLADELVDVTQRALSRDLKPSVLLADAISANAQRRGMAVTRALGGPGGSGIGHIRRRRHPTLTRLRRHGHGTRAKGHGAIGGDGDGVHGPDSTPSKGSRRVCVQTAREMLIHAGRGGT